MQSTLEHAILFPVEKKNYAFTFLQEKVSNSLGYMDGFFFGGKIYRKIERDFKKIEKQYSNSSDDDLSDQVLSEYESRVLRELDRRFFRENKSFKKGFQTRIRMKIDSDFYPFKYRFKCE